MTTAYLDVFVGISGDMLLGALVDAGCPLEAMTAPLAGLPGDLHLESQEVHRGSLRATQVTVSAHEPEHGAHHHHHPPHRSYRELAEILAGLTLSPRVREQSERVLRAIAGAEAAVHGVPIEEVHFHELAGLDTLVDIVGACAGLEALGVEQVISSPLPLSHGSIQTAHGLLPVPPPAVMELLRGVPTRPVDVEGETVTPTGAALAVTLSESIGAAPEMILRRVAAGAGQREFPGTANVLRVLLGDRLDSRAALEGGEKEPGEGSALQTEALSVVETNLDDMNPEILPALMEALFRAGALDVWLTPIQMKKGRPATLVSALAGPEDVEAIAEALLRNSTSLGARIMPCARRCLPREMAEVQTPWGAVQVKLGRLGGRIVTASPEYEDCVRLASEAQVPVKQVYATALGEASKLS